MKIIRGINNINKPLAHPILTIGNFDGVHLGHQRILKKVADRAKEVKGTGIVFTFEPHPRKIVAPDNSPPLLTTFDQKLKLIEKAGIKLVICADFTPNFASQYPEEFIKTILLEKINAKEIIVGHDFTFGRGKKGTIDYFKKAGEGLGFKVEELEPVKLSGQVVSSSLIRDLIKKGDVNQAASFLGRYYSLKGKVIEGDKKGVALGFPTANVDIQDNFIPQTGVYAAQVIIQNKTFNGVANVGYNPTFKRNRLSVEVHILDFSGNLYDEVIELSFINKIRDEITFSSEEELKAQIKKDIIVANKIVQKEVH